CNGRQRGDEKRPPAGPEQSKRPPAEGREASGAGGEWVRHGDLLHAGRGGELLQRALDLLGLFPRRFGVELLAVEVGQDGEQVAAVKDWPAADRNCQADHGCFLAADAIEAATSLAIAICASRSVSW